MMGQSTDEKEIDKIDITIVDMLKENGRRSFCDIGRALGITEGSVRYRVRKLIKKGYLKRFTVEVEDRTRDAIVLIKYEQKEASYTLPALKRRFSRVYELSGKNDIAIHIMYERLDELNEKIDFIRSLKGVKNTETLIRLK
ncbi:Lrp/AsnC family transcriptional regulator [Caldiplasma sukawensis]